MLFTICSVISGFHMSLAGYGVRVVRLGTVVVGYTYSQLLCTCTVTVGYVLHIVSVSVCALYTSIAKSL